MQRKREILLKHKIIEQHMFLSMPFYKCPNLNDYLHVQKELIKIQLLFTFLKYYHLDY